MKTSDFDYFLPRENIAQFGTEPRDASQLFVLSRDGSAANQHRLFSDLGEFLRAGDVLVINDTKVFNARLRGELAGKTLEIFLIRSGALGWIALARPRRRLKIGATIRLPQGVEATVKMLAEDGTVVLSFTLNEAEVVAYANRVGEVPIPPYIKKVPSDPDRYQTVFAKRVGSVAAPTAAFHFTPELMTRLSARGIEFVRLTLHVGLGTFLPVKTENLEDHRLHAEWVEINKEATAKIKSAKEKGRRIIAVGTTSARALEGVAEKFTGRVSTYSGDIDIFIKPGFRFQIIDGLITNFHLPKSTLLMLVAALVGKERLFLAYQEAIKLGYRFYSFGDAMLIL